MKVEDTARSIRDMEIRGAGRIARAAVSALMELTESFEGGREDLLEALENARQVLLASRPTAVSLWNAVNVAMRGAHDADDVRGTVVANCLRFIDRSERAVELIGKIGARRVEDGDVILTHCNSEVALSVIKTAHAGGKELTVYATESRPWRQGLLTVRDLAAAGVPVTLIIDSAVRARMKDVDLVLVGADTITSQGVLINKIGTSQLALCAHEARVDFLVCAETYKFSPRSVMGELVEIEERGATEVVEEGELPPGVGVWNPVFDATPPQYIDSIVTEIGMIPPFAAYEVIVKELGQEYIFEE